MNWASLQIAIFKDIPNSLTSCYLKVSKNTFHHHIATSYTSDILNMLNN